MSHMVIYRGSDGKPGYHQTDDIHDAVGFVETKRNDEGVEQARIFRLEEVVFEYRPYYRVELAPSVGGDTKEVDSGSKAEIEESTESSEKDSDSKDKSDDSSDEDKDSSEEPKKGLFGR